MTFLTSYFVVLFVLKLTKNAIFNVANNLKAYTKAMKLNKILKLTTEHGPSRSDITKSR